MQLQPKPSDPLFSRAGILRELPNRRHRDFGVSTATSAARILHSQALAVVMASTVVKRIPLIRFPARMKSPAPPASKPSPTCHSPLSPLYSSASFVTSMSFLRFFQVLLLQRRRHWERNLRHLQHLMLQEQAGLITPACPPKRYIYRLGSTLYLYANCAHLRFHFHLELSQGS